MMQLAWIAPKRSTRTLSESSRFESIRAARTCFDHLAGRLGVELFQALVARSAIIDPAPRAQPGRKVRNGLGAVELGPSAESTFAVLGVSLGNGRSSRPAAACLDWTEERPHLSGWLGAELCSALIEQGFVQSRPNSRAMRLTTVGRDRLRDALGLELAEG